MRSFDVTGCRAEIFRPGIPLHTWLSRQKVKPKALINGSLYEGTKVIGTVIENGSMVNNAGGGYGFGVVNGEMAFGGPWDCRWSEYYTGYNSPVQGGKYVVPGWYDGYVFGCRLPRIGVARRGDRIYVVTEEDATIQSFAATAIAAGYDTLVNNDGGGSRFLAVDGRIIYDSVRTPYNAIAFWADGQEAEPIPTRNLSLFCIGDDVRELQKKLNEHGADLAEDGIFGFSTLAALRSFQKSAGLAVDGVAGPMTFAALKK